MHRNTALLVFLALIMYVNCFPSAAGAGETGPLPHAVDFTAKLGWTAEDAFGRFGVPLSIFPYRGDTPEEDNVVFYYSDSLYLFWFQNHIWQVRADERWEGEIDGVRMGMNLQEISALWGPPVNDWDEHPTWTLPDRGYPVRIRLYFSESGELNDLYVYRGDW